MNKMGKAWLFGVFAFILMFATACSSEKETSKKSNASKEDEKADAVTLTIGSWRTEDTAKYEKVIEAFNKKHPDIKVEFKPSKNTEYNTILNTALQSGEGPDIIHLRPYAPGIALADAGYLEPLDGLTGLDAFPDTALQASKGTDGKQYGVPLNMSTTQIFYNKKIFKELNLKEPKTWDEFIKLNETLKSKNIIPIALGAKEGWLLSAAHGIIGPAHYGGNEFVEKITKGETNFESTEFVNSIKAMDQLKKYFPDNYEGLGMEDIRTLFATGQAAMFPMGSWEIEVVRSLNPDIEIGFFPMPSAIGKEPTITAWVDGSFALNAKSKHKEEAKLFLEFLATKEFAELFTNEFKMISAMPGVKAKDELVTSLGEAVEKMSTPYMMVVYFAGGNPTSKTTLENELQGMYLGKQTPEGVAKSVQENAETWFKPFQ
ncbi:extracellular solute-binding protein [Neobacillus sedimentimangrovi]|uniref:Probable sugar-binding periplasmic protein n=1 Tax=Neobacillus sedimentimangrovi TaxID=2699460 RepID=A0ABS8QIL2_9BACI|nr:extracellular solute-binding protein [Neobacillus sedimentimangrovi]MCD4838850.1 extracellular solute-binding protein [Neobacillus sedimentimangrovi]